MNVRLRRVGFMRKERIIKKSSVLWTMILRKVSVLSDIIDEVKQYHTAEHKNKVCIPIWIKTILLVFTITVIILCSMAFNILHTLVLLSFKALIIWRGYNYSFAIPSYVSSTEMFFKKLTMTVYFPQILAVFYPCIYLFNKLSSININFSSVDVTCAGAQAPLKLLTDCFVTGFVVVIIESDVSAFWSMKLLPTLKKCRHVIRHGEFSFAASVSLLMGSFGIFLMPLPIKLIQYLLGFVSMITFVQHYGRAEYNKNCNSVYNLDNAVSLATTFTAYLMIIPLIYLFSQVLVTNFKISFIGRKVPQILNEGSNVNGSNPIVDPNKENDNKAKEMRSDEEKQEKAVDDKQPNNGDDDIKKNKKCCYHFLKYLISILSVDWYYTRIVFTFAKCVFSFIQFNLDRISDNERCRKYRKEDRLRKILKGTDYKVKYDPVSLPFSSAYYLPKMEERKRFKQEADREWLEWKRMKNDFPSYYEMVDTINKDFAEYIKGTAGQNSNVAFKVFYNWALAWFLLSGEEHLLMKLWSNLTLNYFLYFTVCIGVWFDESELHYKVIKKFDDFEASIDKELETYIYEEEEDDKSSKKKKRKKKKPKKLKKEREKGDESSVTDDDYTTMERYLRALRFQQFLSAYIASRVVLLQLFPLLTALSVFGVDFVASPIFVFSEDMQDRLPPLIVGWDLACERATDSFKDEYPDKLKPEDIKGWKLYFRALETIFFDSRLINFIRSFFYNCVATGIGLGFTHKSSSSSSSSSKYHFYYLEKYILYALIVVSLIEGLVSSFRFIIPVLAFFYESINVDDGNEAKSKDTENDEVNYGDIYDEKEDVDGEMPDK